MAREILILNSELSISSSVVKNRKIVRKIVSIDYEDAYLDKYWSYSLNKSEAIQIIDFLKRNFDI